MASDGQNGAPALPTMPQMLLSIGRTATPDGLVKVTAAGAVGGVPRFHLELTVFGEADEVAFLANIAQALRDNKSRILRPR